MAAEAATIASTSVKLRSKRQFQHVFSEVIPFTFNCDEDSIADSAVSAGNITVPGAALGDFVMFAPEADVGDLVVSGQVTAADTVTIVLANDTGGAVTSFSGNPKVNGVVLKAGDLFD